MDPQRAEVGGDAGLVVGGAAARRGGRRARSARTAGSPSRRGRSRAARRGGRRAARSARPRGRLLVRDDGRAAAVGAGDPARRTPRPRTGRAPPRRCRCTSPARSGSALTDSIRTSASRSRRTPGRTSRTRARRSSSAHARHPRTCRGYVRDSPRRLAAAPEPDRIVTDCRTTRENCLTIIWLPGWWCETMGALPRTRSRRPKAPR